MKKAIELIKKGLQELESQGQDAAPQAAPTESPRFKKLSDGWVCDKALGIDWGPTEKKEMEWKDAKATCELLGGRLPTVKELRSLVDYEKHDPCIDTNFFPDIKCSWYWTGTECSWNNSGAAWVVFFFYGYVDYSIKDFAYYVRPVRASQCLIL